MNNYYRIAVYHPTEDICAIMDSNGYFEKLWQFSSFLISKGFKIIAVNNNDTFLDVNFEKVYDVTSQIILRATAKGSPESITHTLSGVTYKALKVNDKIYIPDKSEVVL